MLIKISVLRGKDLSLGGEPPRAVYFVCVRSTYEIRDLLGCKISSVCTVGFD